MKETRQADILSGFMADLEKQGCMIDPEHGLVNADDVDISSLFKWILADIQKKWIKAVIEKPDSPKAQVYLNFSERFLSKYRIGFEQTSVYQKTIEALADFLMENNMAGGPELLAKACEKGNREYIEKMYHKYSSEECLKAIAAGLEKRYENKSPESLAENLFLYTYAFRAKNEILLKKTEIYQSRKEIITQKEVDLIKEGVDYGPFLEHFKHSGVRTIVCTFPEKADEEKFGKLISGHADLEEITIESDFYGNCIGAGVFLPNPRLKKAFMKHVKIKDAQRFMSELPDLEYLEIRPRNSKTFHKTAMENKPEKLEYLDYDGDSKEKIALLKKYPDLLVKQHWMDDDELYKRNERIIKAKKTRNIKDIQRLAADGGLLEYLALIDPKDRPTFADLVNVTGPNDYNVGCFEAMCWRKDYKEVIDKVYELCDFSSCEEDANLFRAIKEKNLIGYLESLEPEKRPSLKRFLEPVVKGSRTFVEEIKLVYLNDREQKVMENVLKLCDYTYEDMDVLAKDWVFSKLATTYKKQKRDKQRLKASQVAFEKWKQEYGKGT